MAKNHFFDRFSDDSDGKFELYESQFDPFSYNRQARRKREPEVNHRPKKSRQEIINEIAETGGIEGGFNTTYTPARYEADWLLASIRDFYNEALITDVEAMVKGGKEASVYRCAADPSTGQNWLAAKVYRPRKFRNLRNDHVYREGRTVLTTEGKPIQERDHRMKQALMKGTNFGAQLWHTSWLMYEFTTLQRLFEAGAAVPKPYAVSENAILMGYIGDGQTAAPTLHEISLDQAEAQTLFREVLRNIELMLAYDLIHGDLSAYNILYWQGRITLIDFPQVVNGRSNPQAQFILERDIERVCEYFSGQGVDCDPEALAQTFWQNRFALDPHQRAADLSRLTNAETELD